MTEDEDRVCQSAVTKWCLKMLRLATAHQRILGVAAARAAKAFPL